MNKPTRAQKAAITQCATEILETQEQDLARHRRLCEVCKHPARSLIQEAFLQWTSPEAIMRKYGLKSRATIYHHTHALKLIAQRDCTIGFALGHISEQADRVNVTARDVIQAAYTYAHVNDEGLWVRPPSKSETVVSKHEPAASPLESYSGSAAPMARSASKPTSHRRRPKYTPPAQDLAKSPQELDAEVQAAYLQAAAPDTFVPSCSVAEAAQRSVVLIHNVPRPNRNPGNPYGPALISTNEAPGINTK